MERLSLFEAVWKSVVVFAVCPGFFGFAQADGIQVNGACLFGDCFSTNLLAPGSSITETFGLQYIFANSDRYQLTGTFGASNDANTSGYIQITASDLTLTYQGNASSTASHSDTLVVDFLQYFRTPFSTGNNRSGFESVKGIFAGPLANASSVQAQALTNNGTAMALMGPFYSPDAFSASNVSQPSTAGPTSLLDFRDTITFGDGSGIGSTISVANTPTTSPEPSSYLLLSVGAVLLVLVRRWR